MSSSGSESDASSRRSEEEQEGWDDWEEDESSGFKCLLSGTVFPTLHAALAHDREAGFDLREYMRRVRTCRPGHLPVPRLPPAQPCLHHMLTYKCLVYKHEWLA